MSTTRIAGRAAATVFAAGCAFTVAAAPAAQARVAPDDSPTVTVAKGSPSKAQIEQAERDAAAHKSYEAARGEQMQQYKYGWESGNEAVVAPPVTKAQIERMERAMQDPQGTQRQAPGEVSDDDSSLLPWGVVAITAAGIALGGAAGFSIRRYRHHGQVGAPTTA